VVARAARVIRNSVLSQAKIIDDLLDMSRVRTGKLTLALAPVELAPLAFAAVDAVRADPAAESVAITVRDEADGMQVMADSVRMEQVVMNLLSNAVKFTPAGGSIEVLLAREGNQARLDVVDTGQGIAPSFLPHVFEMFGQSHSVTTRTKGGLGIGLALVREIVGLHGGRVEAHSEGIGKGARFTCWLPLLEEGAVPGADDIDALGNSIAGVRILLVDDVEDVVMVCKALLEMHGAGVEVATSARQGLALLEEGAFDLLISDISMPEMDGYDFLRAVRKMPRYAQLPAIAVSGLAREQDVLRAREAGFAAHIGKPMSVERLAEVIRELLPRRAPAVSG
jgi:two-component system CheB/CheR fusion protein